MLLENQDYDLYRQKVYVLFFLCLPPSFSDLMPLMVLLLHLFLFIFFFYFFFRVLLVCSTTSLAWEGGGAPSDFINESVSRSNPLSIDFMFFFSVGFFCCVFSYLSPHTCTRFPLLVYICVFLFLNFFISVVKGDQTQSRGTLYTYIYIY